MLLTRLVWVDRVRVLQACTTCARSAAADAIKFTVDQQALARNKKQQQQQQLLSPSRNPSNAAGMPLRSPIKAAAAMEQDGMSVEEREAQLARMICSLENKDACLMCGS